MKELYNFEEFIRFWLENPNESITFKKYYTNKGILYVDNVALLPMARLEENVLFIEFSVAHKKTIKLLLPILEKMNYEFYLVKNFSKYHLNKDEFSIRFEDLLNMINHYIIKEIYDIFKEIGFDIQKHIFRYITKYDCYVAWNQLNEERIKKIKEGRLFYKVEKEIIAEISSIDRNFKIFSLIE